MKAYHGDAAVKEKYLQRVRAHQAADELIQGYGYWKDGKGCAVGCTIHGRDHKAYERELGIPRQIAWVEDRFFERLPVEEARQWPAKFLESVPVGADLSSVVNQFLYWLLLDPNEGVIRHANTEKTRAAIVRVGGLYERRLKGETVRYDEWSGARVEARNAWYAADAAAAAAAADAAAAAADAAAAAAAAAAGVPWWRRRETEEYKKYFVRKSEKLLELLRDAPVEVAA